MSNDPVILILVMGLSVVLLLMSALALVRFFMFTGRALKLMDRINARWDDEDRTQRLSKEDLALLENAR